MAKRNRNYVLTIGPTYDWIGPGADIAPILIDPTILVIPLAGTSIPIPLGIDFDIERHNMTNASHFNINIYNLGENNRNFVRKDYAQSNIYKRCELRAGYGNHMPTICRGNINRAYSYRQGTEMITSIEGFDGGFDYVNADYSRAWGLGTPQTTLLADMINSLPFVSKGIIGPTALAAVPLEKGESYSGAALDVIYDATDGAAFVDLETLHVLADNECLLGAIETIDSSSGLLGTPVLQDSFLTLNMIFEPGFLVGQQVIVKSLSNFEISFLLNPNRSVNGVWKVVGVKHRGTISQTRAGRAVTSLSLQDPGVAVIVGAA